MIFPTSWSRLWHAPAFLLLYQVAPVQAHLDELGRMRVALGYGGGHYQDQHLDCDGGVIRSAPVKYSAIGGQAEFWPSRSWRLSAAGGVLRAASDSAGVELWDGTYGTLLLGYEGKHIGIGGGVATWPARFYDFGLGSVPHGFVLPSRVQPSLYLRFGRADKVHFRFDDNASSAPGSPPGFRLGIGSGYAEQWQRRWFVGLLFREGDESSGHSSVFGGDMLRGFSPGFGGELSFPLATRIQPLIQGAVRFANDQTAWNLGVGLRAALGW